MEQQTGCLSGHLCDDRNAFSAAGIETQASEADSEGETCLHGVVDLPFIPSIRVAISGLNGFGHPGLVEDDW